MNHHAQSVPISQKNDHRNVKKLLFSKRTADHSRSFHRFHTETTIYIVKRGCILVCFWNIAYFNININFYQNIKSKYKLSIILKVLLRKQSAYKWKQDNFCIIRKTHILWKFKHLGFFHVKQFWFVKSYTIRKRIKWEIYNLTLIFNTGKWCSRHSGKQNLNCVLLFSWTSFICYQ